MSCNKSWKKQCCWLVTASPSKQKHANKLTRGQKEAGGGSTHIMHPMTRRVSVASNNSYNNSGRTADPNPRFGGVEDFPGGRKSLQRSKTSTKNNCNNNSGLRTEISI